MAFELVDHALLSDAAAALEPETLDAYAAVGAALLNLSGLSEDDETVISALVFQVNFLVELGPTHGIIVLERRGQRSVQYDPKQPPISPVATGILNTVEGWQGVSAEAGVLDDADWTTVRSIRKVG